MIYSPPGSPGLEVPIAHMPESFLRNRKTQEAIHRLWQGVLTRQKIERDFIGLAAPQIGILKSIIVMLVPGSILVFVNPEIVSSSREQSSAIERCISLDHRIHGLMWRANSINVRAFDAFGVKRSYPFQ